MTRFKMFRISTQQFAILKDECKREYSIRTDTEIKHSNDGSAIAILMAFSFVESGTLAMILKVMCEFSIHPDDLKEMTSDGKITIPKSLLEHFLVHTVGTARGILHCKTEGTPFNAIILPPIDVTTIIKTDLVIPLQNK